MVDVWLSEQSGISVGEIRHHTGRSAYRSEHLHSSRVWYNFITPSVKATISVESDWNLPVYLPQSLSVWVSKFLMSVCQTRTVYWTDWFLATGFVSILWGEGILVLCSLFLIRNRSFLTFILTVLSISPSWLTSQISLPWNVFVPNFSYSLLSPLIVSNSN